MSLVFDISDKVTVPVAGTINDEKGVAKPFSFKLLCKRLDADELESRRVNNPEEKLVDFLLDVVEGWSDVKSKDGTPIPFSEDALRKVCSVNGMDSIMFFKYRTESGAKAKN